VAVGCHIVTLSGVSHPEDKAQGYDGVENDLESLSHWSTSELLTIPFLEFTLSLDFYEQTSQLQRLTKLGVGVFHHL
jgi:hypothetical protein